MIFRYIYLTIYLVFFFAVVLKDLDEAITSKVIAFMYTSTFDCSSEDELNQIKETAKHLQVIGFDDIISDKVLEDETSPMNSSKKPKVAFPVRNITKRKSVSNIDEPTSSSSTLSPDAKPVTRKLSRRRETISVSDTREHGTIQFDNKFT